MSITAMDMHVRGQDVSSVDPVLPLEMISSAVQIDEETLV